MIGVGHSRNWEPKYQRIIRPHLCTHTADQNPFNSEEQVPIKLLITFAKQAFDMDSLRY
jgi:hypothetical protein